MSASICRLCGLPQVTAGSEFLHIYSTDDLGVYALKVKQGGY